MARDIMYYFDKKSPYSRHELGEIQTDFNMGNTIDGTKDSLQVQVYNFSKVEITPNTILYHNATNTWWIVKKDKMKRFAHENEYYYQHDISLLGAIDLLNSRDLTDCGFNDDTYTIDQFIKRLFKLSTFEFDLSTDYGNNLDKDKIVDYIKSYENYTPLSALRDFLGGYNCDAKLSFSTDSIEKNINGAILKIIPKTGNVDLPILDIDIFDDIRENRLIDKDSYGTTVVSNAQNVVSTLSKTYPQVGGVKVSSNNYSVTPSNAVLRLPTPIYKINWVRLLHPVKVNIYADTGNQRIDEDITLYPYNKPSLEKAFEQIADRLANFLEAQYILTYEEVYNYIKQYEQLFYDKTTKASSITIKTGWSIKPLTSTTQDLIEPQNDPDFRFRTLHGIINTSGAINFNLLIGTKEDHDSVVVSNRCMYYERGESVINNFAWLGTIGGGSRNGTGLGTYKSTDLNSNNIKIVEHYFETRYVRISLKALNDNTWWLYRFDSGNTFFQVNYIPMSDIKIKQDNQNNNIDTKLYNQNGKLNDSVALSKLIDSYSNEIQNETITKYAHYTNFNDVPKIGQMVKVGNDNYVINNISCDFSHNETNNNDKVGYYIDCEFTISKYISTKSILTNPNSNIRDYGIPQKYNVKRRQVYRDYYEFTLNSSTQDSGANQDTPYVPLDRYIVIGTNVAQHDYDHTAIMKIDYAEPVDNNSSWYYQLNTTAYVMNKSLYEVIDFNDNNIIGYDIQNVWTGFTMSKLFNNNWKTTNVPISYVDDSGKFKGITLQMVSKEKINELYDNISIDENNVAMYSSHVFVGETFYNGKYTPTPTTENKTEIWESDSTGYARVEYQFQKPERYISGSMTVDNFMISDEDGNYLPSATAQVNSITETDDYIDIVIDVNTGLNYSIGSIGFRLNYQYGGQVYQGAIDIKDYEIKELDYNKDAIEVPVFEYILQLGDTEEVEIGERILDTNSGLLQMYTCEIRNPNTITQLNASKVFSGLEISGDTLSGDDNYDRQVSIADTSAVDISFEENNTIMRIKVYLTQEALFYGNSDQEFAYQETQVSPTQVPKSSLIGKDIVIYKNVINSMTYDIDEDNATCDYDNELMFIIHNPQESNFDGDDLLVNINYYRLK